MTSCGNSNEGQVLMTRASWYTMLTIYSSTYQGARNTIGPKPAWNASLRQETLSFDMQFIASTLNLSLSSHVPTINHRECFFPLISLRFRRALEPHVNPTPQLHRRKGLKASGNLLVGFSGGLGSSVLLDLVHKTYLTLRGRQEEDQNPNGSCPWPEIFVATVDISGALTPVCVLRLLVLIFSSYLVGTT